MIVKNEAAIIDRCLVALAPHLVHAVICDTGSTDGTPEQIRTTLGRFGVTVDIHHVAFIDFAQARNTALERARSSRAAFEYLVLVDADMELQVAEPGFREGLRATAYQLRQENGLSYYNVRLLRRDAAARYRGATHEYLDISGGVERLDGAWFVDHADGANRAEKFERDIRLLTAELEREPNNTRAMFYLAQTLKDAGRPAEAIPWYERRIDAGGWDEERWYARYMLARCHHQLGEEDAFIARTLEACDARPGRAEPLVALARHYRESGHYEAAMLVAETARAIPYPFRDILFVEKEAYGAELAHEISVSGFYCSAPARKAAGREAGFGLTTRRSAPPSLRQRAIANARFYAQPLAYHCPSFATYGLNVPTPDHWHTMNPSIAVWEDNLQVNIRTVNYQIRADGTYDIADPEGTVRTVNQIATLDDNLSIVSAVTIDERGDPGPVHPSLVVGFEDARLFSWSGSAWLLATSRDRNAETMNEMVLARLDAGFAIVEVLRLASPEPHLPQKNWMPVVRGDDLLLVYRCDPTVILTVDTEQGAVNTVSVSVPAAALDHLRGGSQLVPISGGWIAATHEVAVDDQGVRTYLHRFVGFDPDLHVVAISDPFFLTRLGYEFCAGMTRHPRSGRLLISFGVQDREAWLGSLELDEVLSMLRPA